MKNNFEEFIRQSVERQDPVDYNPAHWSRIAKELDKKSGSINYYIGGALLVGAIAAGVILSNSNDAGTPTTTKSVETKKAIQAEKSTQANTAVSEATKTTSNWTKPVNTLVVIEPISRPSSSPALALPSAPKNEVVTPTVITKKITEGNVVASISVSKTNGCAGEAFYFAAQVNVPATYLWTFGDGKSSDLPNPNHIYAQPGKYGVSLKLTSLIDGKSIKIADGTIIAVNAKPSARFNYTVDEDANFSRVVEFGNQTRNTIGSQWIVDGKFYNEEEPRVKINRKGSYPVSLIVKNDLGCYDTLSQSILVDKDYNLLSPNAFTPNDDNQNDDFLPAALRNTDLAFKMDIIDPKTGAVIYTSTKQPWDGLNSTTGRRSDGGTYLWMVTLTRSDNSKEVFKGNVSIIK